MSLYFVFLRRPKNLSDKRNDPFWEFGSFGKTRCHAKNLLNPKTSPLKNGDKLVFLQGGNSEIRIIGVTPPIRVKHTIGPAELLWDAAYRPHPYSKAPLLINNNRVTGFPAVLDLLRDTQRSTLCGAAGSRLRGKTKPIDDALANQIVKCFSRPGLPEIETYLEAIEAPEGHWHTKAKEHEWATYTSRLTIYEKLGQSSNATRECVPGNSSHFGSKSHC